MKQRITIEQMNELTDQQKHRVREWWIPVPGDLFRINAEESDLIVNYHSVEHDLISYHKIEGGQGRASQNTVFRRVSNPLLSIGQMIEFLHDHAGDVVFEPKEMVWRVNAVHINRQLADALWIAVKSKL